MAYVHQTVHIVEDLPPIEPPEPPELDEEEGGDNDVIARLDTMSGRLRELILEGQKALGSGRPVISEGEGWEDELVSR